MKMRNDHLITGIIVFVAVIIFGLMISANCEAEKRCYEDAEHRTCIPGTVSYDYDDAECECLTHHGELDWSVGMGCELD